MGRLKRKKGGMISSPASYPQGKAWSANTLPGVVGNVSEGGNFFPFNTYGVVDPPIMGGRKTKRFYKRKRKTRRKKGGSRNVTFGPVVNFMRNTMFHANSLSNMWNGKINNLSPMPTVQALNSSMPITQTPDVMKIHAESGSYVSNI